MAKEEYLKEEYLKEEYLKKMNYFLYYTVNKENNRPNNNDKHRQTIQGFTPRPTMGGTYRVLRDTCGTGG